MNPRRMIALVLSLALAGFVAPAAVSRAFTVEDLLMTEGLGQVAVSPDGRWLVFERQLGRRGRPQMEEREESIRRSRLYRVDLAAPGEAAPLIPLKAKAGDILLGFSPAGSRAAIARLEGDRWRLGVVTLASGQLRWFNVAPDYYSFRTTLGWASEDRLVLIARHDLKLAWTPRANAEDETDMITAWATAKAGRVPAVTAVGSGADIGMTPYPPDLKLLSVNVRSGDVRVLATGQFESLALSPDGGHVALTEVGAPIRISTPKPISVASDCRRRHLVIVDLSSGRVWRPCPGCDVPFKAPIWSGSGQKLLFYGRTAEVGWSDGHYWQADAAAHTARQLNIPGLRPFVRESLNDYDAVGLAWIGETPAVYARLGSDERPDWIALPPRGPEKITATLATSSMTITGASGDPVMVAKNAAWRLADLSHPIIAGVADIRSRPQPLAGDGRARASALFGRQPDAAGWFVTLGDRDQEKFKPFDLGAIDVLTTSVEQHAVIGTVTDRHGVIRLRVWRRKDAVTVAELNLHLADVDTVAPRAIFHRLSDGTKVTSWLFLPYRSLGKGKPPLVVIPYSGAVYGSTPPHGSGSGDGLPVDSVATLCGHGYAVLRPSMPALAASDQPFDFAGQILSAVDAVIEGGWIDSRRMALWGHSFGAYTVAMTASETDRFNAVIAENGPYDPLQTRGTFSPDTRLHPEYFQGIIQNAGWSEQGQGGLQATPWSNPARYVANSVLFRADHIHTPMLMIASDRDFVALQQSEQLFSALYRQGKDAILLTYWHERHSLTSPANIRDSYRRIFDWLDKKLSVVEQRG